MDFFLHIGYNMDFKCHRCEGKVNKKLRAKRKKKIQKAFWEQLKLHIDIPRDGGAGNSNTGFDDYFTNEKLGIATILLTHSAFQRFSSHSVEIS